MILVTGGTGLVGAHLLSRLCLTEQRVHAICRRDSDLNAVRRVFALKHKDFQERFERVHWIEADLLDLPALELAFEGIHRVYHCAAQISFQPKDYHNMRKVNIGGTTNVVNLCIAGKIDKLCYVSSVAAIENRVEGKYTDEEDNWNNNAEKSGYAITKYGAELEVWRASQEGVKVVIVNPGVILGAGFWHQGSGSIFRRIDRGLNFYTSGLTGFVSVGDVVEVMTRLMDQPIDGERYILVAENRSFQSVFFEIADRLKKRRPRYKVGKGLLGLFWRLEWLISKVTLRTPAVTKHTAKSAVANHPYAAEKIEKALDFQFKSLDQTIAEVCAAYQAMK